MRTRLISICGIWGCGLASPPSVTASNELPGLAPITEKLERGEPLVFATFGDSITWPCYHTDYRQNYMTFTVDALRRAYPQARIRVVHAGNMGTAARGLAEGRFERHHVEPDGEPARQTGERLLGTGKAVVGPLTTT